jgi:hypothetical protein
MDRMIQRKSKNANYNRCRGFVRGGNKRTFAAMKDISGGEEVDGKVRHLVSRTYTIWFNPLVKEKEPL